MGELRTINVRTIGQPDENGHRKVTSGTGDVLDRVDVGSADVSRGDSINIEATAMKDTDGNIYQVWKVRSVTRG